MCNYGLNENIPLQHELQNIVDSQISWLLLGYITILLKSLHLNTFYKVGDKFNDFILKFFIFIGHGNLHEKSFLLRFYIAPRKDGLYCWQSDICGRWSITKGIFTRNFFRIVIE